MHQANYGLEVQRSNCRICEKKTSRRRCLHTSAEASRRPHRERTYCLSELRVSETEARGRSFTCQGRSYFSRANHVFM